MIGFRLHLKQLPDGRLMFAIPLGYKILLFLIGLLVLVSLILTRQEDSGNIFVRENTIPLIICFLSFLGAAYTWRERGHVRITFLVSKLPLRVASWLRLVTLILTFLFLVGLCQASYGFIETSFVLRMASATSLRIPLAGPHMNLPVGFTLLAIIVALNIVQAIRAIKAGHSAEETRT